MDSNKNHPQATYSAADAQQTWLPIGTAPTRDRLTQNAPSTDLRYREGTVAVQDRSHCRAIIRGLTITAAYGTDASMLMCLRVTTTNSLATNR